MFAVVAEATANSACPASAFVAAAVHLCFSTSVPADFGIEVCAAFIAFLSLASLFSVYDLVLPLI